MRNCALLVAGVVAVVVLVGCSDDTLPSTANTEQSSGRETLPAGQESEAEQGEEGGDAASASAAPTVADQAPGSPLVVAGAELAAPVEWQVSGVSSDDSSEVVGATSADGQFISLRSVRTDATAEEQIAAALEADAEQTVAAPEVEAGGETLRGVETAVTASGGQAVRLQYFVRRGDSLITIDVVTTGAERQGLLEHLRSGLTWR